MQSSLYFLAILPPKPISEDIRRLKQEASKLFNAKHALNSPAHITLIPPFWINDAQLSGLLDALFKINSELQEFDIALKGFGQFEPNVLFVHVEKSSTLNACHHLCRKIMEDFLRKKLDLREVYHPHATIAFKDLDKDLLQEAYDYFSKLDFNAVFSCSKVSLLRYANKKWQKVTK